MKLVVCRRNKSWRHQRGNQMP